MFKRFTDRVTAAVLGSNSPSEAENDKVKVLETMGFDRVSARNALARTNWNIDDAAVLLLQNPTHVPVDPYQNVDEALRNALEESLQTEEQRLYGKAQQESLQLTRAFSNSQTPLTATIPKRKNNIHNNSSKNQVTATIKVSKAGQAAARRAGDTTDMSTLQVHHPDVKIPTKLEDKSKEEQILRNVNRLKPYPNAVDTLLKALTALRNDPNHAKYRKVDKLNPGYQRSLASVPGAESLLLAMNFVPMGTTLVLDRIRVDPALLFLGISALEEAKKSVDYLDAKRQIQFMSELKAIHMEVNSSEEEALKRARFIAKCPTEPPDGRGALVQVTFGEDTIKRRFDGDDVLLDLINWLGGHGSVIPDKLLNREWCLVDKNRVPISPIDVKLNHDKTLQFVGFWPSGKLEIRPSSNVWLQGTNDVYSVGSSRGLGAAPSDTLG
jgi:Arc/MetJ-type ribon-helix-helix transcriptional regulator